MGGKRSYCHVYPTPNILAENRNRFAAYRASRCTLSVTDPRTPPQRKRIEVRILKKGESLWKKAIPAERKVPFPTNSKSRQAAIRRFRRQCGGSGNNRSDTQLDPILEYLPERPGSDLHWLPTSTTRLGGPEVHHPRPRRCVERAKYRLTRLRAGNRFDLEIDPTEI